jgi:V/A-type H+-transporting ATPase subunit K
MIVMRGAIRNGTLSAVNGIGIGTFVGLAIMMSAIYQGKCAVTAIQAAAKQPAVYGKTLLALGIVESFALFAFVFAMLLI